MPAHAGLTFTTTFDSTVNAAAQSAILSGLTEYGSLFSDNVNVSLGFKSSGTGLGTSLSSTVAIDYKTFYNALVLDSKSVDDSTALTRLAVDGAGFLNPASGTNQIEQGRAGLKAVGLDYDAIFFADPNYRDGIIDLNLGIMNFDRISIDPNKYDLKAVLDHEVNEVLGSISGLSTDNIRPVDLFRFNAAGSRTYTTAGDDAYFSINGSNLLARYNQIAGSDYGDFYSCNDTSPTHLSQVQDACTSPGTMANMGVETRLLDVVGWDRQTTAVLEPETYALMLAGLGVVGFAARRRKADLLTA